MCNRLLFIVLLSLLAWPGPVWGAVVKSRYVSLHYGSMELLREFNEQLVLTRKLRYSMRNRNIVTVQDEVLAKLDVIIEKVEIVLDMFPDNLHIAVVLLPDSAGVSTLYQQKYGERVSHIAYYSLSEDTIYISVADTRLRVIAHEMGHAVVDHYFQVRPPYNIHELMAQFAEKHVEE